MISILTNQFNFFYYTKGIKYFKNKKQTEREKTTQNTVATEEEKKTQTCLGLSLLTMKCDGDTKASDSPPPLVNERDALDTPELADTQVLFLSDGCPHEPQSTVRLRRLYSLSPHVLWAACRWRQ